MLLPCTKNKKLNKCILKLHVFLCFIDCPGTESEQAGKVEACQGCPNQNICASSKPVGPDPGKLDLQWLYIEALNYKFY